MRRIGAFGGSTALWALLAAHAAAAFEPVSVGIAIGAVSALTGYLSYTDFYCRFTECCQEERPLNTSGMCPQGERGARGGRAGRGRRAPGTPLPLSLDAAPRETHGGDLATPSQALR